MSAFIDIKGQKFERLTVVRHVGFDKHRNAIWLCRCDCGEQKALRSGSLRTGHIRSCGCLSSETIVARNREAASQNGEAIRRTPEYRCWWGIKSRCYNPNTAKYNIYGGAGVTVCARWLESYSNFLADMGRRPSPKHSIDRYPNPAGNYEPTKCRWATPIQQRHNRRGKQ